MMSRASDLISEYTKGERLAVSVRSLLEARKRVSFNPMSFFGMWFLSKKKLIPQEWIDELASLYPYRGRAFRMDDSALVYNGPLGSWTKSVKGMQAWTSDIDTGSNTEFGIVPFGMQVFETPMLKGVDLAAFVKDQGLDSDRSGRLIIAVEEVFPIEPVKRIERTGHNVGVRVTVTGVLKEAALPKFTAGDRVMVKDEGVGTIVGVEGVGIDGGENKYSVKLEDEDVTLEVSEPKLSPIEEARGKFAVPSDIDVSETVTGAHSGQVNVTLMARRKGKVIGKLDYAEFQGVPHIQMVSVPEQERGQGIATALVGHLANEYGYRNIQWGMVTGAGHKLKKRMDRIMREATKGAGRAIRLIEARHSGGIKGENIRVGSIIKVHPQYPDMSPLGEIYEVTKVMTSKGIFDNIVYDFMVTQHGGQGGGRSVNMMRIIGFAARRDLHDRVEWLEAKLAKTPKRMRNVVKDITEQIVVTRKWLRKV